jgi:hypothetical protein
MAFSPAASHGRPVINAKALGLLDGGRGPSKRSVLERILQNEVGGTWLTARGLGQLFSAKTLLRREKA